MAHWNSRSITPAVKPALKNTTWLGDSTPGEQPIAIGERRYLVTRPMFGSQSVGVVYLYEQGVLKRRAAVGRAGSFAPLRSSAMIAHFGRTALGRCSFAWSDRNGDGDPQPDEVQFWDLDAWNGSVGRFEGDLSIDAGTQRFEVKSLLPNGAPLYQRTAKAFAQTALKLGTGGFFHLGVEPACASDASGKALWTHPAEGWGVQALPRAKPFTTGQVVAQFDVIGHETAKGPLGEFLVTSSNTGTWHVWSADGLLAGRIFRDQRSSGARPWSMPEHQRGMDLSAVTLGQEHFNGYFTRSRADGRYYAVAGHNHISIAEVRGIDQITRLGGNLSVGPAELSAAMAWDRQQQARALYESAKVLVCSKISRPITIDGKADEWTGEGVALAAEGRDIAFRCGYDQSTLYVCFTARNAGPMKNLGNDWRRLFKTGAAVDLCLGVVPGSRSEAGPGDVRLLMTLNAGKPVAVLYQPVKPGAPADQAWETHTTTNASRFDSVVRLDQVRLASVGTADAYVVEAAIPLSALGLSPTVGQVVKCDWGVLVAGPDGNEVMQRLYWANQQTSVVADEAAESQLHPEAWGSLRFDGEAASTAPAARDPESILAPEPADIEGLLPLTP